MIEIYPSYRAGSKGILFFDLLASIIGRPAVPFFSGRSAIVAGLSTFGLGRMDEILVPPYLGHCVLSAISRTSFPTMTSSKRTKAILVYHQFGFPQHLDKIETIARGNNWIILNDCASTLFTKVKDKFLIDWGDITVISFAKIYHCGMGGGLYTNRNEILPMLQGRDVADTEMADEAFDFYLKIQNGFFSNKTQMQINAFFGYLPDIKSIATLAMSALPGSLAEVISDRERRRGIYMTALKMFDSNVPVCDNEVVPFAIPISGEKERLLALSEKIQGRFDVCAPVLHFDFARNMLEPDYRPALVIGCHDEWNKDIISQVFKLIETELR